MLPLLRFLESQIAGNEAALKTDISQQAVQEKTQMSLCLALLLVAIGINWWNGWEPFTYPLQTPWT
jgi:hypothetical protein